MSLYGVGTAFPPKERERLYCRSIFEEAERQNRVRTLVEGLDHHTHELRVVGKPRQVNGCKILVVVCDKLVSCSGRWEVHSLPMSELNN